jgi:hypothetical protein
MQSEPQEGDIAISLDQKTPTVYCAVKNEAGTSSDVHITQLYQKIFVKATQ